MVVVPTGLRLSCNSAEGSCRATHPEGMNGRIIALLLCIAANGGQMSISATLMAIYHVRQDNGCWGVMRGREASFGYFRQKADAI